jgi:hypothetical protein
MWTLRCITYTERTIAGSLKELRLGSQHCFVNLPRLGTALDLKVGEVSRVKEAGFDISTSPVPSSWSLCSPCYGSLSRVVDVLNSLEQHRLSSEVAHIRRC